MFFDKSIFRLFYASHSEYRTDNPNDESDDCDEEEDFHQTMVSGYGTIAKESTREKSYNFCIREALYREKDQYLG